MKRNVRWFFLAIVRPLVTVALIVNGIPPTIRAVGSAISAIVKAFR